jgi:hypothetical protein
MMARRVLVGCANCKVCSGSAAGNALRATAGLSAVALTGGFSLLVPRKKCGACRHKLSDHITQKL